MDTKTRRELENKLCSLIDNYFNNTLNLDGVSVRFSKYDFQYPYTANPYCNYRGYSCDPQIDANDSMKLNEFKKAVRLLLKQYGFTKVRFEFDNKKIHYGYVSGPDDFPVKILRYIMFS